MLVRISSATSRETHLHEYLLRFLFGGLVTGAAGLIAQRFGPAIGGLFMAFPAIFPATVTLVEKYEIEKKSEKRLDGRNRGRQAAALESVGTALGSFGLLLFAGVVGALLPRQSQWTVLIAAGCAWALGSAGAWQLRRKL